MYNNKIIIKKRLIAVACNTIETVKFDDFIKRKVINRGDIANAPRTGVIEDIKVDRWGTFARIVWDDPELLGWDKHGHAVRMREPESSVSVHLIGRVGAMSRFVLID